MFLKLCIWWIIKTKADVACGNIEIMSRGDKAISRFPAADHKLLEIRCQCHPSTFISLKAYTEFGLYDCGASVLLQIMSTIRFINKCRTYNSYGVGGICRQVCLVKTFKSLNEKIFVFVPKYFLVNGMDIVIWWWESRSLFISCFSLES
jgi:hypothetical protein